MTNLKKKYISIFDKTKGMSHLKMTGVALNSALVVFIWFNIGTHNIRQNILGHYKCGTDFG